MRRAGATRSHAKSQIAPCPGPPLKYEQPLVESDSSRHQSSGGASSTQFIEHCICPFEVRQVESFGEPVMEGAEEIVGLVGPV